MAADLQGAGSKNHSSAEETRSATVVTRVAAAVEWTTACTGAASSAVSGG
ncbi:hypothetical protein ACFW93_11640 [Streptomyces canus]